MTLHKKEICLHFSDFPGGTNIDFISKLLKKRYEITFSDTSPDYVIHSVFGNDFLRYGDAVRICFIGENVRPDFNLCDFAFSFDWLGYEDRHFRAPNFVLYPQWDDVLSRKRSTINNLNDKPDFCNFIYTNGNGHPHRVSFFHFLNARKKVESFGRFLRNSDRTIDAPYAGDWSQSKVEAQKSFRFSIAFENSETPGYTTEKIVHALSADTIPIYWGDPFVGRIFNPGRFINVRELGFEGAVDRIEYLEQNPDALLETLNAPFFSEDAPLDCLTKDALLDAFSYIFDQPTQSALRRERFLWGPRYETTRKYESSAYRRLARIQKFIPWSII